MIDKKLLSLLGENKKYIFLHSGTDGDRPVCQHHCHCLYLPLYTAGDGIQQI